jgi:hypothetical protein
MTEKSLKDRSLHTQQARSRYFPKSSMAAYKNKGSRNPEKGFITKPVDDSDSTPKPIAATLMQEFQNLKDKFKNEDGEAEKGERNCVGKIYFEVLKYRISIPAFRKSNGIARMSCFS